MFLSDGERGREEEVGVKWAESVAYQNGNYQFTNYTAPILIQVVEGIGRSIYFIWNHNLF